MLKFQFDRALVSREEKRSQNFDASNNTVTITTARRRPIVSAGITRGWERMLWDENKLTSRDFREIENLYEILAEMQPLYLTLWCTYTNK